MANGKLTYEIGLQVNKAGLNDLQATLNEIKNLTASDVMDLNKGMDITTATKNLNQLKDSINIIQNGLSKAYSAKLGTTDINKFNNYLKTSKTSLSEIQKQMTSIGVAGQNAFRNLTTNLLTSNLQLKETKTLLDKIGETMSNTIKWGISSSIFNNFTGSIQKSVSYVKTLDKDLNNIRIVSGQSAEQMESFAKQANKAAKALGTSTTAYAEGAQIFYQQGLKGSDVTERTDVVTKMANVTGDAADEVSSYMTAIWNNFYDGSQSLEHYADVITALGASTASSSAEIAEGLEKFAAVGQTIGLTYDYATAALATVVANTRQSADTVGTAFKTIFSRLQGLSLGETLDDGTSLTKYSKALEAVGVSIKDQDGELKDMNTILDELANKWSTLSKDQQVALAQTVAGTRQYTQLVALMDNWDDMTENLQTAANATGELNKQQSIYMDSIAAHEQKLNASIERLNGAMLDENTLKNFYDLGSKAVDLLSNMIESIGGGEKALTILGSTALRVFGSQIGKGLTDIIYKFNQAGNNLEIMQQRMQLLNNITNKGAGYNTIVKDVEEISKYYKVLTPEVDAFINSLLQEKNELLNQQSAFEQNTIAAKDFYSTMSALAGSNDTQIDFKKLENWDQVQTKFQEIDILLDTSENKINEVDSALTNLWDRETEQNMDSLDGALKEFDQELDNIIKSGQLSAETLKELTKAQKEYKQALQGDQEQGYTAATRQEIQNMVEISEKVVAELQDKNEKAQASIFQVVNKTGKQIKNELNEVEEKIEETKNKLSFSDKIANISNLIGMIGQLATAINSLTHIKDIITDEDLSAGEKLLQIISALAYALPTIFSVCKALGPVLTGLKAGLTGTAAAATGASSRMTALGVSMGKAALSAGSLLIALAAIAALMALAVYQETKEIRALEEEKKKLQEVQTEYVELTNTIKDYQSARDSIDNLTEGTAEFYEALIKTNEQAQELIDKYKLIAGTDYTIDVNGRINISDKALKTITYNKQQDVYAQQAAIEKAQLDLYNKQYKQTIKEAYEEINKSILNQINSEIKSDAAKNHVIYNDSIPLKYRQMPATSSAEEVNSIVSMEQVQKMLEDSVVGDISKGIKTGNKTLNETCSLEKEYNADITKEMGKYSSELKSLSNQIETSQQQYNKYLFLANISEENYESYKSLSELGKKLIQTYTMKGASSPSYGNSNNKRLPSRQNQIDYQTSVNTEFSKQFGYYASGYAGGSQRGLDSESSRRIGELYLAFQNSGIKNTMSPSTVGPHGIDSFSGEIVDAVKKMSYEEVKAFMNSLDLKDVENGNVKVITDAQGNLSVINETDSYYTDAATGQQQKLDVSDDTETYLQLLKNKIDAGEEAWNAYADAVARAEDLEKRYYNSLANYANDLNTTSQALEIYGNALEKINGEYAKNETSAEYIAQQYQLNKLFNSAVSIYDKVSTSFKKYKQLMQGGKNISFSAEDADNVDSIISGLKEMGIVLNRTNIKDANVLSQIEKLFEGTEAEAQKAYAELKKITYANTLDDLKTKLLELKDAGTISVNIDTADFSSKSEQLANALKNLGAGESIGSELSSWLINWVNQAKMSADEVSALFNELEIEVPPLEQKTEITEDSYEIPASAEKHHYSGQVFAGMIGNTPTYADVNYSWQEWTEPYTKTFVHLGENVELKTSSAKKIGSKNTFAKSSGNSSGSSSKKQTKEHKESEENRYQRVNEELANLSATMAKLQKQEDRLIGSEKIDNLIKQIKTINSQIDSTREKLLVANTILGEKKKELLNYGIQFDADGLITNYSQIYQSALATYNAAIDKYNNSAQGESDEKELKEAEKTFNKITELVTDYDELIGSTIPDLEDNLEEYIDSQIELKIKVLDANISISLDFDNALKQWAEFKKKVLDDIKSDNYVGEALFNKDRFKQLLQGTNGTSLIQELVKNVTIATEEFTKVRNGETSTWFSAQGVNSESQALAYLKEKQEQLMQYMEELDELEESLLDNLISQLGKVQDKMDEQNDLYENLHNTYQHNIKLIQSIYGDTAYSKMSEYYKAVKNTYDAQYKAQQANTQYWLTQMSSLEEGTEQWNTARDNWISALETEQSTLENYIQSMTDEYINSIQAIFEKINEEITSGNGLDYISEEWGLINKEAEHYLDTVNATYGIQQIANKYLDAIDQTDNIKYQEKLRDLMNEQVKALKEQDRLTQYDLDRAELKYQIALKRIQLEEAQQNKSTMRLRRDSQGNYTYQYASDNDEVSSLQEELSNLYNQLYNMDTAEYKSNLDSIYSLWTEYQQKMVEAAQINDPEERLAREKLLTKYYGDLIDGYVSENEEIKQNLYESTFLELEDLYGRDSENVRNWLDDKDSAMKEMIYGWNSTLQQMADKIREEGGFTSVYGDALDEISKVTDGYQTEIDNVASAMEELVGGNTGTTGILNNLVDATEQYIKDSKDGVETIKEYISEIDNLTKSYEAAKEALVQLQKAQGIQEDYYKQEIIKTNQIATLQNVANASTTSTTPTSPPPEQVQPVAETVTAPSLNKGSYVNVKAGTKWYGNSYGGGSWGYASAGTIKYTANAPYGYNIDGKGWIRKEDIVGYASGGYTGDWTGDGKLALLHQKEIVLNAKDTANLLNTVAIMRNITNSLGEAVLSRLSGLSSGAVAGRSSDTLQQQVAIEANFPNVTSANEIEEALNNLVNAASQYIGR